MAVELGPEDTDDEVQDMTPGTNAALDWSERNRRGELASNEILP